MSNVTALLGARSSAGGWDAVPTQPHSTQRQMEGGMGTKRWEEERRGDNKKGEWREMGEQGKGTV